ncbi:hypothetical protein IHQ71_29795 (plasmid) [Rhizobium sp. TH2]|uniref:hypothetical protein n=1 Tax=Rhizobium sp. TH2 TaxID=2775403 RepID=UPI00215808DF|nr:hypothetical protein [Rhizobium sp. TH2]UVC12227.1 hypothetical protein IHQ71_29795 [Rhizobium sp. TH2]
MALTLRVQIPVATIAVPPAANERKVMVGHFEDSLVCYEADKDDTRLVARLVLTGEQQPLEVRKLENQFLLEIAGADLNARSVPFERHAASNLFLDGSVHTMFREVFESLGESLESLSEKWNSLPGKPLSNLRRMRLRDIDEALAKAQADNWQDYLKPPVLIDGRLFRPCDEPFVELALEDYRSCCSLFVDRDWCSHETYAVYSLREVDAVKPMAAWLRRYFEGTRLRRDFKIVWMDNDPGTFSVNFIYRRFGMWGEEVSRLLSWKLSTAAVKFAAGLTPAHQSALLEIDRAVRSTQIWTNPNGTDVVLSAVDTLRHDPYFELHRFRHVADRADILIEELDGAPVEMSFGPRAMGIG